VKHNQFRPVLFLICALALVGCARFKTTQIDDRKAPNGESTTVTTIVSASTLWSAKSKLTDFKANQTEKSQGASVGSLAQESTGTNTVEFIRAFEALARALRPTP
jgi:hypothetical protein